MVIPLHRGKDAMAQLMGPTQGIVDGWIQDPNILGPKKSRERLLLKDLNLLDQVGQTISDSEGRAKNPEREINY